MQHFTITRSKEKRMETIKWDLYLNRLIERRENGLIKVVTGIRRCRKSYLLFKLYYRGFNVDVGVVEHSERDENGKVVRKRLEVEDHCG